MLSIQGARDDPGRSSGKFQKRVGAKDLILAIAADIGADGATYQAIEFTGKTIAKMDMAGRMTCCNMAIEMGAKAGIVPPDKVTWDYMKGRGKMKPFDLASDDDAKFTEKRTYNVSDLEPQVAVPHNVDQGVPVSKVEGTHIDQVFIGSCTNGRYEDMAEAAEVLGKKKFSPKVRVLVIPASRDEYLKALESRTHRTVRKSGSPGRGALLRALHGRVVRPDCPRRSLAVHLEPEFQGPSGKHRGNGVSLLPGERQRQAR